MIPQKKPHKEKMIEASKRMIREQQNNNPALNNYFKLQIKTLLQNAPRDAADKLERLLKVKERQKDEAMYMQEIHTKVGYRRD